MGLSKEDRTGLGLTPIKKLEIPHPIDEYVPMEVGAAHAGRSLRTLWDYVHEGLPVLRLPVTSPRITLVHFHDIDAFLLRQDERRAAVKIGKRR